MQPTHILIAFILLLIITTLINGIVQEIGHYHYTKSPNELFDIGWKYGPNWSFLDGIQNLLPILLILSLFFFPTTDSILKEILIKFTIIMLVRALTTISTILPKDPSCTYDPDSWNIWKLVTGSGCYDKVFSGHTAFVALFTLIYLNMKFINIYTFWILNVINMVTLVFTRNHYTVDVILGFVMAYLVYDGKYPFIERILSRIGA